MLFMYWRMAMGRDWNMAWMHSLILRYFWISPSQRMVARFGSRLTSMERSLCEILNFSISFSGYSSSGSCSRVFLIEVLW